MNLSEYIKRQLDNPEFLKEYDALSGEYEEQRRRVAYEIVADELNKGDK